MQTTVERLKKALEHEIGLSTESFLAQDGIYRLTLSGSSIRLFIYADFVETRITLSDDLPSIHLDNDVLKQDFDKVISRLTTVLGFGKKLHARQTVVARIDKQVALQFQQEHHLQVALPGKYRYGLFFEGELVSIAVFSGGRKMKGRPEDYRSFELLRFCHKGRWLVVGGLSKLIKAFQKDFDPGDIMTYVDRDWSQDSTLKSIGFEEISIIPPQQYVLPGDCRKPVLDDGHNNMISDTGRKKGWIKYNNGSTKMTLFLKSDL